MTVLSGVTAGTYTSWFSSVCCAPLTSCLPQRSGRNDKDHYSIHEKQTPPPPVVRHQPRLHHQPPLEYSYEYASSHLRNERPKSPRKSSASSRTGFSVRKRQRSDASSRKLLISGPTDFRHIRSGSYPLSDPFTQTYNPQARRNPPRRRGSLERLELSIHSPSNQMSPMLPHFELPLPPMPPSAHIAPQRAMEVPSNDQSHERSYSTMSFHVPRKAGFEGSPSTTQEDIPPLIPPKAKSRARAHTSSEVDVIKERVASAMIEVERLQKQIDDVIERQSIYAPSRPSTSHSMARTMPELEEPMPSIPALPPAAPSFAERLKDDSERPKTAPMQTRLVDAAHQGQTTAESSASPTAYTRTRTNNIPLPPPLPLVLRPPLRKKKSFSRVSNWLSMSQNHHWGVSLESVTNQPRPVKGTEGFYQCVPAGQSSIDRRSFGSVGSVSTWDTDEEEPPTTLSPGSTPITKTTADRSMTFGDRAGIFSSRAMSFERSAGITIHKSFGVTA